MRQQLLTQFEPLQVNVSEANDNKAFLKTMPAIKGYPSFIILDEHGQVLGQQNTALLEQGKGYSVQAFEAFLQRWTL